VVPESDPSASESPVEAPVSPWLVVAMASHKALLVASLVVAEVAPATSGASLRSHGQNAGQSFRLVAKAARSPPQATCNTAWRG